MLAAICVAVIAGAIGASSATPKFYNDDPLQREPETQDASGVQGRDINLVFDLTFNLFARPGDPAANVRAQNINTIDEVPDSNWFTNRLVARTVTPEEAARGPLVGSGPAPGPWTITQDKRSGFAPGFTMRDSAGETWFVSFDGRGYPEAATGAILVANKIFWTLGYWQVENHLATIRPENIVIAETATVRPPSGVRRRMTKNDLDAVLARANRSSDGSYRAVAARAIPGRPVDGFFYYGTRTDDPNDVVPHEHRRELRALKVFGAWTNLVDMKAGNTLDSVIMENGRSVVRHYLQDVGSTFGTGANAPREYRRRLGVPVRRRSGDEAPRTPSDSRCRGGRPWTTRNRRRSADSKGTPSTRWTGNRASRRRPSCVRDPTTRSGRRAVSPPSRTR